MELRCPNGIKFGELDDGGIEVKCRSSRCGAGPGVVIIHRFNPLTGKLLETKKFRDPVASRKDGRDTHDDANSVAVRSS